MKFELSIESDNSVAVDDADGFVADNLRRIANEVDEGFSSGYVHDGSMGGAVGHWELTL